MYSNYLDHPTYGRLWYSVSLRNWNVMGNTMKQNLEAGPSFVASLSHYSLVVGGLTLEDAVSNLKMLLDISEDKNVPLNPLKPRNRMKDWWQHARMSRLNSKWKKEGFVNPVIVPPLKET